MLFLLYWPSEIKIQMENKAYWQSLRVSSVFTRFIVGFGAGFVGTIVLGIVLLLSWSIVGETLSPSDVIKNEFGITISQNQTHPLFLSIVTLAIFLATLVANFVHTFLICLVEENYTKRSTALTHVFFGNLIFLLLTLPAYLLANSLFGPEGIAFAAVFHTVITAMFSAFILETLHQSRYLFVNLYGILLGITLFFVFGILTRDSQTMLTFMTLPILLGCIGFGTRITEVFYGWLYETYGVDVLNINTRFGNDYGRQSPAAPENDLDI